MEAERQVSHIAKDHDRLRLSKTALLGGSNAL
jgi:hypothetical protein